MASGEDRVHDLWIVGAGPAGMSCALQGVRDGLDLVLAGDEPAGGLLPAARRIDNLAGLPGVTGRALAGRMARQLAERGVVVRRGRVVGLRRADGFFRGLLDDGAQVVARAVCLATGTRPRPWPPGGGRDVPR
ncbi:MAG: NAD(P)/FAD-dependent oxidoreductase, partial [Myxococcales bacterium]|nr:NAD(P)/FAD-dependent oxidoreductase [Myxococcales bacterium]